MEFLSDYRFLMACGYFTAFFCSALGFLVRKANPRSRACTLAFCFNISTALWSGFYANMYLTHDNFYGLLVSRMLTLGTILLNVFVTHLVLLLIHKERSMKKLITANYFVSAIFIVILFSTRLRIRGSIPKLDLPAYTVTGPLYFLIPIHLFLNFFYSIFQLYRGILREEGYRKSQLKLFLWAMVIGYVMGIPAFFLCFDIPIKPVTTPYVAIYPLLLTIAIVKHRFLDIKKLVKNTLVFSLLFTLLLGVVSIVLLLIKETMSRWIGMSEALAQVIAIALAIGLYGPLKRGLSRLTNRLLYQHEDDAGIIFRNLSKDIIRYLNIKELSLELTKRIAEILQLNRVGFYFRSNENPQFFELQASLGRIRRSPIQQTKPLVQYLEQTQTYIVNEMTQRETRVFLTKKTNDFATPKELKEYAAAEVSKLGGVAAFPVFVKGRLRAIFVAGRKKSDAPWRVEEFAILKSFMRHLSLAVRNAEYANDMIQTKNELSRSERDAATGSLIAGVGHEVKNPLYTMALRLSTLRRTLTRYSGLPDSRETIEAKTIKTMTSVYESAQEVNHIIGHLSDLAHRKPLSIREGLKPFLMARKAIQDLAKDKRFEKISIRLNIEETLEISYDPDALYEIFANLIRNDLQAIQESGEIILENSQNDGITVITVRDTGTGIPKDRMDRIFEPFFTTKRKQTNGTSGTGMGLFIVKEYMNEIDGDIEVESRPNEGTIFKLSFPNLKSDIREAA